MFAIEILSTELVPNTTDCRFLSTHKSLSVVELTSDVTMSTELRFGGCRKIRSTLTRLTVVCTKIAGFQEQVRSICLG